MKIHEYQAKEILNQYEVPTPRGRVTTHADQAKVIAHELGGSLWVIKAQIHAGGRGKAGGVKLAKSEADVQDISSSMIGMTLISPQTGPEGKKVNKILVETGCTIAKEYYVAILLDRAQEKIVVIASPEGGMSIEEIAETHPEKIYKEYADSLNGFREDQLTSLGKKMGYKGKTLDQFQKVIASLYRIFVEKDATLVEINPLILTKEENLLALDAKMGFDDNALFRHPEIEALRDLSEEDPKEVEAAKFRLSYIRLDGEIGCMVNGAGLAMATMDIIKLTGSEPANFLDVGGGASQEQVKEAFQLILSDKNVKGVLVNIFGGIMRCDVIARGILDAVKQIEMRIPLVVRLEGTNVEEGRKILKESGLKIITGGSMEDAAQKIVRAIQ